MATDVERIAEVLEEHEVVGPYRFQSAYCLCGRRLQHISEYAGHVAEQLSASGIGHVPTALHQAADALERQPKTEEWLYAADVIRARADRSGGEA